MLLVQGRGAGVTLTGTLYERGEEPPSYGGAPDDDAPYVFDEVESGGVAQQVGDREIRVAFETPAPRGFDSRERALAAARDHVRTQFARIGVDDVEVSVVRDEGV